MKHNLFIGVLIAPYRVDLCNWLYERLDCEIYHLYEKGDHVGYDLAGAEALCRFERRYLPTGTLGHRPYGKGLRRLIRAHRPEVVFVPEFSLVALQVLWIRKTSRHPFKVVSICDDSLDMVQGNDFSRGHRLLRRWVPRWLDNLILVSEPVAAWYQAQFGKGVCLPIIADEKRIRAEMEKALPLCEGMAREYGLEGKKVILYVGRLVAIKNVGALLEAAQGLDAKVVIIGDGPMRASLEAQATLLGVDAVFTGRKSGAELLAWYHLADVFVLPSLKEPFGAVVNEALLAGCPAVVSSLAGSSCLITATNGAICDPSSLPAALRQVLAASPARPATGLRPSLMPVTFEDAVSSALRKIL